MTFSQNGEDDYLAQTVFRDQHTGRFLEIGAHDGVTFSNTLLFERLGWVGTCVEPVPANFEQLRQNRACRCLSKAVVGAGGSERFVVDVAHPDISGYRRTCGPVIHPEQMTLGELLDDDYDLVSIDTEGTELDILQAYDFSRPPRVFVVEHDTIHIGSTEHELIEFFRGKPYRLIHRFPFNLVFLRSL